MKILVTGATGFLGQRICQDLLDDGYEVRALGRNQKIGEELRQMGCDLFMADLRDMDSMSQACEGIDMVVHSGALSSPWGKRQEFYTINVVGTENIVNAAIENKVKRFIHISTPSVYFNFKDRFDVKESDPVADPSPSIYTETKLKAEKAVAKVFFQGKIETITLRPRGIFGPGDTTLIPRLINAHDKGKLPIIGDGSTTLDITYVDNVSQSVLLSLKAGENACGKTFNITNDEPVKLWDTVEYILGKCGRVFKRKKISFAIIYVYALFSELFCKYFLAGREPTLTRYTAGLLAKSQTLNIDEAKNILGYEPKVKMQEALEKTIAWYLSEVKSGA